MPIFPSEFVSTWYYFTDAVGNKRLIERWEESETLDSKPRPLLQGDTGTHVMDIGGKKWVTAIDSPVVIIEEFGGSGVSNVFDLLKLSFNVVRFPSLQTDVTFILKSADISIAEEGVTCKLTYWSDAPGAFVPNYGLDSDFIARVARFYDTRFYIADSSINGGYQIKSGSIKINVDINENYFINTASQYPYFSIQGYHVNGSVEAVALPSDYSNFLIPDQRPGLFSYDNVDTTLVIGNVSIGFGSASVRTNVSRIMQPNQITTTKMDFDAFTRYTTPIL